MSPVFPKTGLVVVAFAVAGVAIAAPVAETHRMPTHSHHMTAAGQTKTVPPPPAEPALTTPIAPVALPVSPFIARAKIISSDQKPLGDAIFREGPTGVLVRLELTAGLTPGWHAIHFHAVGNCADAAFATAGAHVNHTDPTAKLGHGLLSQTGPDFGDLTNIFTAADGTTHAEAFSSRVTLTGAAGREMLMDADGTSLVIHANPDDHLTQPIGGAGGRVACGVIKKIE